MYDDEFERFKQMVNRQSLLTKNIVNNLNFDLIKINSILDSVYRQPLIDLNQKLLEITRPNIDFSFINKSFINCFNNIYSAQIELLKGQLLHAIQASNNLMSYLEPINQMQESLLKFSSNNILIEEDIEISEELTENIYNLFDTLVDNSNIEDKDELENINVRKQKLTFSDALQIIGIIITILMFIYGETKETNKTTCNIENNYHIDINISDETNQDLINILEELNSYIESNAAKE